MTTTLDVIPPNGWRLETENDKEDPKKSLSRKTVAPQLIFMDKQKQDFMSA